MFSTTSTVVTTRTLPFPLSRVLAIVQSPGTMIRLNPLVISAEPSDCSADEPSVVQDEWTTWSIVDRQYVLGGMVPMEWAYEARFEKTEDGMISYPKAGMGVHLKNVWKCEPAEGGGTRCKEVAEISASWLLIWFVAATVRSAHTQLMGQLEEKLAEGVKQEAL